MNPVSFNTVVFDQTDRATAAKQQIEEGLKRWVNDPNTGGNKQEAARDILEAFNEKSTALVLRFLELKSIPPEIGCLVNLEKIDLSFNNLESLPPEIGSLVNLEVLICNKNNLKSLPTEIECLVNLDKLELRQNNLKSLPTEIGSLVNLKRLELLYNNLKSLSPEIGRLVNLEVLNLHNNHLKSLPPEIGNLVNLTNLEFGKNPDLEVIPLSLGNIPGITHLPYRGTKIPQDLIDHILALCRATRGRDALDELPRRLALWKRYATGQGGQDHDPKSIESLEDQKKYIINEWLLRLSKTSDFSRNQRDLAKTVCAMLATLQSNEKFRDLFFVQVETNNERCDDRASMAFNELYTCWKLCTINKDDSLFDKLKLLANVARTIALRNALAKILESGNHTESVEIFLYYETLLRERLGLMTAIQNMRYSTIGKREWIDEEALKNEVEAQFLHVMAGLPAFEFLAKNDPSYVSEYEREAKAFEDKMNQLDKDKDGLSDEEYCKQASQIRDGRKDALSTIAMKWATHILEPEKNQPKHHLKRRKHKHHKAL